MITIALDTGNKQIKTENDIFTAGITMSENIGIVSQENFYRKDGKYYALTTKRQPYMRDKTTSDRYFNLVMLGIAKELFRMESIGEIINEKQIFDIHLLLGLPPAHMKDMQLKRRFQNYFKMSEPARIFYMGKTYLIQVKKVNVYSQCFAALTTIYPRIKDKPRVIGIDMGGFTADYIVMERGKVDVDTTDSLESGIIILYQKIKKACAAKDYLVEESDIDNVLSGNSSGLDNVVIKIVKNETIKFVDDFLNSFREFQIDLKNYHVVFIGGAALMLRPFIENSTIIKSHEFIEDINANAKGYKMLYQIQNMQK